MDCTAAVARACVSRCARPPHLLARRLAAGAVYWAQHASTAEEIAAGIWRNLSAWCGDESHHDDMTLLVLRVPR